jgi:hypothetical protein
MKTPIRQIARRHCANFNLGICLGAMFKHVDSKLTCSIDSKYAGKDCIVEKGCVYFEQIVIPGLEGAF